MNTLEGFGIALGCLLGAAAVFIVSAFIVVFIAKLWQQRNN